MLLGNVKIKRETFFSNFVAFSQYVNFKNVKYLESRHSNDRGNGDENTVGTRFERRKKALFAIKVKMGAGAVVKVILQSCAKKYINFVFRPKMAIFGRAGMRQGVVIPTSISIFDSYDMKSL